MKISREISFFDLETTGLSTLNDSIVEITIIKIDTNGKLVDKFYSRVNPEMPISEGSRKIHGISDEDVANEPTFKEIANDVLKFIEGSDLCGYNIIKFDMKILIESFFRAGVPFNWRNYSIIDVYKMLTYAEPRTLSSVYERFTGKCLENAHSSDADVNATIEIFEGISNTFQSRLPKSSAEIQNTISEGFSSNIDFDGKFIKETNSNGDTKVLFNFGKYKGMTVNEVFNQNPNYFNWMIDKGGFSTETSTYAKKIYNKLNKS